MHSLALDLHDDIAQELYLVRMENTREKRDLYLDSAIEKIRRLSYEIRPGKAAALSLGKGIQSLLSEYTAAEGWQVDFSETGTKDLELPYEIRIHLYRVVQEALQNIGKHAEATKVTVRVLLSFPKLMITITDNGRGFDTERAQESFESGLGIRGMQERMAILNGSISIQSRPVSWKRRSH